MSNRVIQRKSWRVRYSLRAFLLVLTLASVFLTVWISLVEPIQCQWRAARALLEIGATLETEPTSGPAWVTWILPAGQSENIVTVKFNRNTVTQQSLEALRELPHLQRLYMERAGVNDEHLVEIAKLKSLRRLSLWGNSITDQGARNLIALPNLEIVDLARDTRVTWRTLYAFRERKDVEVKIDTWQSHFLVGDEINQLASLGLNVVYPAIGKVDDEQISRAIQKFEKSESVTIFCDESEITRHGLQTMRDCQRVRSVTLQFDNPASESLVPLLNDVSLVWGSEAESVSMSRSDNRLDFGIHGTDQQVLFRMWQGPPVGDFFAKLIGLTKASKLLLSLKNPDSQTMAIVQSLPNLRHLEFTEFRGMDDNSYQMVARLDSLEFLKLHGSMHKFNANIPVDFFATLACRASLRRVDLRNVGITREHLLPLLEYPRLESLMIHDDGEDFNSEWGISKEWLPELRKGIADD